MVNGKIGAGKCLIYQTVYFMNLGAIILTITPTIALMEDQERKLRPKSFNALALIATPIKAKRNI